MKKILFLAVCFLPFWVGAQNKQEVEKANMLSEKYTRQGNQAFKKNQPIEAESDYRKAISENKDNATAQFNLGNTHYYQKSYAEAFSRYKEASVSPQASNTEKQSAFHNLGNLFMQQKAYDKAVEAYKEALRNNPNDEETRYNLAVAKEMLKKNPPQNQDKKEDKKEDKKDDQKSDKNQDQSQDKQQDKNNSDSDKNQEQKDKNDSGNQQQDNDKQQGQQQKDPNQEGREQQNDEQQGGKNRPSSLSTKQMERILEAMNQEERKVQEKVNAQKVKGRPAKSDKDW